MKSRVLRLQLAALVAIACASCDALADNVLVSAYALSWTPPTLNADGSPITDLMGYYIYAGVTLETMTAQYFTAAPGIQLNFFPGARYFAIAAVNNEGLESDLTLVISPPDL